MMRSNPGSRLRDVLLAGSLFLLCFRIGPALGADYGRLSGTISDSRGNPLMGATVLIIGPVLMSSTGAGAMAERVITDAQGRFAVEHLVPGWYSLKVTSPTHLPVLRNGIRIEGGQTSSEKFVLSDVFAPLRFQIPDRSVSSWGDDWKWVLRTSASTRPILRYQQEIAQVAPKDPKIGLPPSRRLIGMLPGSARGDSLAGDPGVSSVLAYLRPLSEDSDLLVAGSLAGNGIQASSVATVLRKNMLKGNPQELALIVHQLSFSEGGPVPRGSAQDALSHAQGIVASYTQTRLLSPGITMTAGIDVTYLNAAQDILTAQPHLRVEYQVSSTTVLAAHYGPGRAEGSSTLLERVGMLNAFPQVTLRNYRARVEQLNHAEASLDRRLGKSARLEIAAYRDALRDAAVWASSHPESLKWLAGNFLPNAGNGIILNAGDYDFAGLRAAYSQNIGSHVEALVAYAVGGALVARSAVDPGSEGNLQSVLRAGRSTSVAGKVSAQIPVTHTRLVTSYEWGQRGRVTGVDPYGQADLQLQPFLGFQIRQPLPNLAFLPAHIEALADFRNLLAQGYVPLAQSGEKPMLLSQAYRCFRGGFSVQF